MLQSLGYSVVQVDNGPDAQGRFVFRKLPAGQLILRASFDRDLQINAFGIGWGPAWLFHEDLRTGRLVEVLAPWRASGEPLWMLRTSDRRPPLRTQRVMSFLATLPAAFSDKAV